MALQQRSLGAYTSLEQLMSYQLAAKHLSMLRNTRAIKHLAGPYKSTVRGRGMEFEDVRLYQAGDDVRTIDWRVSARVGITHTKQFREEREKPVMLIVDQRQSMFFGSKIALKSVLAADIAAYIAWASLAQGDKIGALIFNDAKQSEIRPRAHRKNVLQLLQALSDYNQQLSYAAISRSQSLYTLLQEAQRICRPGTRIFLLSDFHDVDEQSNALLYKLSSHCEINAIQIYDPLEQQLPVKGRFAAFTGQQSVVLDSANKQTQTQWQQHFDQHQADLKKRFGQFSIPLIPISTQDSPLDALQNYFGAQR